jgi:heme-degrading monooxygenase HmoA
MYARMFSIHVSPDKVDDLIQLWQNSMLPLAQAQKGWKSAQLLVDRETGKTVIIGMWETEADAVASGVVGGAHYEEQHAILRTLVADPPAMEMAHYELAGAA